MKIQKILFSLWVLGVICFPLTKTMAETLPSYQEEIQRLFLREAGSPGDFKKAVQTARLLGYLEFLPTEVFSEFQLCFKKENRWEYLSAKKREKLLNLCKGRGRALSSVAEPTSVSIASVRPANEKKIEQQLNQVRAEIGELRTLFEKLSKEIRNQQDRILGALTQSEATAPSGELQKQREVY